MARIKPIGGKSDVAAEYHHVVDGVLETFGQVRGPFSMLLHSPKLAERLLPLVHFFRSGTVVEGKDLSLAILVAAREREGAYVWARQVDLARQNGVREEAIDLIRRKGDPAELPPEERDIVVYARQLAETNRVDGSAFEALRARHDERWLVELTAASCYYGMLSGVVSAFEVPAPEDGDRLPT
jgi:4-carboxymuconolactone decarboxylase